MNALVALSDGILTIRKVFLNLRPRSHYSVFVQKNLRFCESVHTDMHKNARKRRFSKTLSKVDIHKNGGFCKRSRSM